MKFHHSGMRFQIPQLFAVALALVALMLFSPPQSKAQLLQGALEGNVTDASRAAIVGAEVTISNEQTNAVRTATTGAAGNYSFPTTTPGSYTLRVVSTGFQAYVQTGVSITINNVTRVNVALEVGQVTETITVEASAATLQTDRAEVRAEVDETALKNLPVPLGRNYQMLFVTLPGFSPPQDAHSIPSNPSRAVQFSVNGTSRSNNNTRIDGASSTNIWLPHMTSYLPGLEAIETVNVVTNSFDAEQGLAGGAAINVSIKSGGNDVHGSLFEYHTNNAMRAYPYVSDRTQPKPKFIFNQFGGTVGGPIKKDKLFYFVSYDASRESQFANRFGDVPTPAMKRGDLSLSPLPIYDPFTGAVNATGRTAFENNQIPLARIDSGVQKIIDTGSWADPNKPGIGSLGINENYLGGGGTTASSTSAPRTRKCSAISAGRSCIRPTRIRVTATATLTAELSRRLMYSRRTSSSMPILATRCRTPTLNSNGWTKTWALIFLASRGCKATAASTSAGRSSTSTASACWA
jgi:hypothetical protein